MRDSSLKLFRAIMQKVESRGGGGELLRGKKDRDDRRKS